MEAREPSRGGQAVSRTHRAARRAARVFLAARLLAAVLSMFAVACSGNPGVGLTPLEPPAPFLVIPLKIELNVTVVDSAGSLIDGAEVILQAEPAARHITTRASGVVRFVGLFIVPPRFFIVCAPGFICSEWIDMQAAGFGSMKQTVTLQRAPVVAPHLPKDRP